MTALHTRLTIVVPVRNSMATIGECLQSLVDEVPSEMRQIVVVDNGSTDGTPDVARRYPVELMFSRDRWVAASRNTAARTARHEVLAFVDSDCIVKAGWLATLSDALADRTVGVVGCLYEPREIMTWVEDAWNAAHRCHRSGRHAVEYVPSGNLAIRREVFEALGGFDEALETGEDMDLCQRCSAAGYTVVQDDRMAAVHLGEPKTLVDVFRRNRWHGRGARLRYPNGRWSAVIPATGLFVLSGAASVWALWTSPRPHPALAAALLAPAIVPAVYAARYARPRRPRAMLRLWAVYLAYFAGRAAALPAVARAGWRRSQG